MSFRRSDSKLADVEKSLLGDRKTRSAHALPLLRRPLPVDRQLRSSRRLRLRVPPLVRIVSARDVRRRGRARKEDRDRRLSRRRRLPVSRSRDHVLRRPDLRVQLLHVFQLPAAYRIIL